MQIKRKSRGARVLQLVTGVATAALLLSGCAGNQAKAGQDSGKDVTVGLLQTISGAFGPAGKMFVQGAQLAADEINAKGGIKALGGAKVSIETVNTTSDDVATARTAAATMVSKRPAFIIGGGLSAITLPIQPIMEKARIPVIAGSISDKLTNSGYKYYFQIIQSSEGVGKQSAGLFLQVADKLVPGKPKVALVYSANVSTAGEAKGFVDSIDSQGGAAKISLVLNQEYPFNFTNGSALAQKIKDSHANVLLAETTGAAEFETIERSLKAIGVDLPIFNPGAGFPSSVQWLDSLGDFANGQFVVAQWDHATKLKSPEQDALLKSVNDKFVKKYKVPFMSEFAGEGYVAMWQGVTAIERGKSSDPEKIRKQLSGASFTSGPASLVPPGTVHYNDKGLNVDNKSVLSEWCKNDLQTVLPSDQSVTAVKPADECHVG
jgi:branched-chain amino acid transport system substrate-binding protein